MQRHFFVQTRKGNIRNYGFAATGIRQAFDNYGRLGTGKTRLEDTISHLSLAEFADGVHFVALAPIDNHEFVAPIIVQTLGVREVGGKSLWENLVNTNLAVE